MKARDESDIFKQIRSYTFDRLLPSLVDGPSQRVHNWETFITHQEHRGRFGPGLKTFILASSYAPVRLRG